jgi:hypothetical protein
MRIRGPKAHPTRPGGLAGRLIAQRNGARQQAMP